jgi:hypothetical protein
MAQLARRSRKQLSRGICFRRESVRRKSRAERACPIVGRNTLLCVKTFNLLVMYGAMLLSDASPPARSAWFDQKLAMSGSRHAALSRSRKGLLRGVCSFCRR